MKMPDTDLDTKIKEAKLECLKILTGLLSGAMIAYVIIALYLGFVVLAKLWA